MKKKFITKYFIASAKDINDAIKKCEELRDLFIESNSNKIAKIRNEFLSFASHGNDMKAVIQITFIEKKERKYENRNK